ncbi:cation diffusion facilitator family transporter [Tichowtungia aerotolerans]|uniref:Cation diffusion facilitator family transporter n=1 Tax=Tichowtungia aerotolerans TaxID=2697043 RepID=A0A6P1M9Z0_9BACT|nr:cation diffusion facilitator family transporter [Tichowtungia aerotolerans]QHI70651.1 cation diffusion facilitator family transporter [Tichowtungia aerotolerans]
MSTPSPEKQIRDITAIGLVVNLLLSALKFSLGIYGRSQAVVADAVHSLSDMGTDLLILLGVKFWSAPADERHPYGHQRVETVVALCISFLLATVAFGFGADAVRSMSDGPKCPPLSIALLGPLFSIVSKEILFRRTRTVGKRIHSSALIANAWHHRSDALSSIPALVAVAAAATNPKWAFLDPIGALVVAILILKVAWDIASPALSELMDHGAGRDDLNRIRALAQSVPGVRSIHRLRTRRVGSGWFVDLHAEVDPDMTVRKGHDIATQVQFRLLEDGPSVADVTVHIEPDETI